jgi:hypothetical protein
MDPLSHLDGSVVRQSAAAFAGHLFGAGPSPIDIDEQPAD